MANQQIATRETPVYLRHNSFRPLNMRMSHLLVTLIGANSVLAGTNPNWTSGSGNFGTAGNGDLVQTPQSGDATFLTNVVAVSRERITAIVPSGGGRRTGTVTVIVTPSNSVSSFGKFLSQ